MNSSLPKFLKDVFAAAQSGGYVHSEKTYYQPTCTCKHHSFGDAMSDFHNRPLYVISSVLFDTLEDARNQLVEYFDDDTLDSMTAVYQVWKGGRNFYVLSTTELDTKKEADAQLVEWHNQGILNKNARVYKTSLVNTYEIHLGLVRASKL